MHKKETVWTTERKILKHRTTKSHLVNQRKKNVMHNETSTNKKHAHLEMVDKRLV